MTIRSTMIDRSSSHRIETFIISYVESLETPYAVGSFEYSKLARFHIYLFDVFSNLLVCEVSVHLSFGEIRVGCEYSFDFQKYEERFPIGTALIKEHIRKIEWNEKFKTELVGKCDLFSCEFEEPDKQKYTFKLSERKLFDGSEDLKRISSVFDIFYQSEYIGEFIYQYLTEECPPRDRIYLKLDKNEPEHALEKQKELESFLNQKHFFRDWIYLRFDKNEPEHPLEKQAALESFLNQKHFLGELFGLKESESFEVCDSQIIFPEK